MSPIRANSVARSRRSPVHGLLGLRALVPVLCSTLSPSGPGARIYREHLAERRERPRLPPVPPENLSSAPHRGDLDLDLHLGTQQPAATTIVAAGRMSCKTVRRRPRAPRRHRHGRQCNRWRARHPRGRTPPGRARPRWCERRCGSVRHVDRHRHGGIVIAGGSGHEAQVAVHHRPAVAALALERRSGGNQAARHRLSFETDSGTSGNPGSVC